MDKIKLIIAVTLFCIVLSGCGSEEQQIELSTEISTVQVTNSTEEKVYVYVSGQVKKPGVYQVSRDSRVYQVIDKAGGMTKKAKKDCLNLAETVCDGQNICVISKSQYKSRTEAGTASEVGTIQSDIVNINIADVVVLSTLPGIGSTKADAIVAYREENGNFNSIEDIKNVSGIGEATYSNIKDLITV